MIFGVESKVFKRSRKPTAEKSTTENLRRKSPIFIMENIFETAGDHSRPFGEDTRKKKEKEEEKETPAFLESQSAKASSTNKVLR